ncbi:MAG: serine/threonine-protein kinase, partial [Gemmatimonadales bacterium]
MTRSDDTARWNRAGELFHELVELDDSHRSERLSRLRSADRELCEDVETLIAGDAIADERLPSPGFGLRLTAALPQADPLRLEGQMVARFRVLEHVASGGMGVVYRAEDTQLDRTVALKFPLLGRDLSDSLRTRIINEARSAGALDHANLCPIYEIGESSAGPFFAMPLYRGETLKQRLARTGRMDVSEALAIATQLAAGLECAHRAGIVHRDMKPGNVMLVADGTAKVLDFGLARTATADVSNPRHALGTILYMAPEQIRGEQIDHRVDLWSLGVILYEMLAGARPFAAPNDAAMLHSILRHQPPPLREIDATIPPAVEELVARLLEKDQRRRAQSAQEVIDAIAVIVERNESSTTWRTLPLPSRRLRNRAIFGTAVALVVALTGLAWLRPGRTLIGQGLISPNDTLVIADFSVLGVDSALSRPLTQVVRRDFADSKLISLMSPQLVRSVLERMRRSPGDRLTAEIAREVAQREGARAVIEGELAPLKSGYLVTLRLVAAESGDELSSVTRTAANPEKDLLPALADAGQTLRSRIGESLRNVPLSRYPKRQVTTSSLAALRVMYAPRVRTNVSDMRAIREAIAIDSTFAYAWMTLGNFLSGLGRSSLQDSAITRAYRYSDHLTLMERAQVAAFYDMYVLRDRTRARVVLEAAVAQDSAIWFAVPANVAGLLMETRQFDRADAFARRMDTWYPHDRGSWIARTVIAST